jgi:hypothetical protein
MIGPALGLPTLAFRVLVFWVIGFGSNGYLYDCTNNMVLSTKKRWCGRGRNWPQEAPARTGIDQHTVNSEVIFLAGFRDDRATGCH